MIRKIYDLDITLELVELAYKLNGMIYDYAMETDDAFIMYRKLNAKKGFKKIETFKILKSLIKDSDE